jgi:alkylation response protein AidB-like acyl-CoA dehydrogenase
MASDIETRHDNPGRDDTAAGAAALHAAVRRFVDDVVLPGVASWDREDELPDVVLGRLVELGLSGALVPVEHGGAGLGVAELVPAWRILSQGWISLTGALNPTGLATALLARHGTPEQQARWLPGIARGAVLASFSITEPQAGSDLGRIETTVRRRTEGGLELEGRKRWVAGGVSSHVVFLMAEVEGSQKPSCIILPADGRGSATWQLDELEKVGYRGVESAAYTFHRHPAPGAEVLGGEERVGAGARQMLDALDVGRVNVACRALGIIDRALVCALGEAVGREIGDGVLADHSHARMRVGAIVAQRLAVESLIDRAAAAVDARDDAARELSTAAKVVASDTAIWAVDRASRLAASRSYAAGDELARLRRDAPQTQIGEGANDALLLALAKPHLDGAAEGERLRRATG